MLVCLCKKVFKSFIDQYHCILYPLKVRIEKSKQIKVVQPDVNTHETVLNLVDHNLENWHPQLGLNFLLTTVPCHNDCWLINVILTSSRGSRRKSLRQCLPSCVVRYLLIKNNCVSLFSSAVRQMYPEAEENYTGFRQKSPVIRSRKKLKQFWRVSWLNRLFVFHVLSCVNSFFG